MYALDRLLFSDVDFSLAHIITKEGLSGFIFMGYGFNFIIITECDFFIYEAGFFNLPFWSFILTVEMGLENLLKFPAEELREDTD